jgi:stringent starvation protein B
MDNDGISFQARFGGVARDISIPIGNVSAIYARENGAGMAFEPESATASSERSEDPPDEPPEPPPPARRARLQRIK